MNTRSIIFVLILFFTLFLFSCKEETVITDLNSENELHLILGDNEENSENEFANIFDEAENKDVTEAEKEISITEETKVIETAPNESDSDIFAEIEEVQQTDEEQETNEQIEIKPYNDIYVVINGTKEYHRTDCEKLKDLSVQEKSLYTSEKELYFNDILPCNECKPNI